MPAASWSALTRRHLPIILIRGFGGLTVEDEKALAYQGFNDGSVYPQKRGENYIYEGLILRLLKHRRQYYDATNVVGYFANPVTDRQPVANDLTALDADFFTGHKVVIDAGMALRLLQLEGDPFCKPPLPYRDGGWRFKIEGTGFEGTLQIELDWVPEDGPPRALDPRPTAAGPTSV